MDEKVIYELPSRKVVVARDKVRFGNSSFDLTNTRSVTLMDHTPVVLAFGTIGTALLAASVTIIISQKFFDGWLFWTMIVLSVLGLVMITISFWGGGASLVVHNGPATERKSACVFRSRFGAFSYKQLAHIAAAIDAAKTGKMLDTSLLEFPLHSSTWWQRRKGPYYSKDYGARSLQVSPPSQPAPTLSDIWKCPNCSAILRKGSFHLFRENLARGAIISGTATCAGCGAQFSQTDVYGGKYDVKRTLPQIQDHMEYVKRFDYVDRPETRDWQKIDELRDVPRLANDGRVTEASERLNKSLERYSDLDFIHAWIGILLEKQGKVDQARDAYMRGVKACRNKHYLCERMGDLELKHGAVEDALMWFLLSALSQLHSKRIGSEGAFLYLVEAAVAIGDREAGYVLHRASAEGPSKRYGGVALSGEARQDLVQKIGAANQALIRDLVSQAAKAARELGPGI